MDAIHSDDVWQYLLFKCLDTETRRSWRLVGKEHRQQIERLTRRLQWRVQVRTLI